MTCHLSGKRIQIIKNDNIYNFQLYSGTHPICGIAGACFSLERARKVQKKLARIFNFKVTEKIRVLKSPNVKEVKS